MTTYPVQEDCGFWDDAEIISEYSRAQAIQDGVLIDATVGDFAEVTRQHFKVPVAMTAAVFSIIERAVDNPRLGNDFRGVWHDVCTMSKRGVIARPDPTTVRFQVIIRGAGRSLYVFKAVCGPGDDADPVITIMLPEED